MPPATKVGVKACGYGVPLSVSPCKVGAKHLGKGFPLPHAPKVEAKTSAEGCPIPPRRGQNLWEWGALLPPALR